LFVHLKEDVSVHGTTTKEYYARQLPSATKLQHGKLFQNSHFPMHASGEKATF